MDNEQYMDKLESAWVSLCIRRMDENPPPPITFDSADDNIIKLMEMLADLSNLAGIHFIKLALYQDAINSEVPPDKDGSPVGSFTNQMPEV